MNPLTRFASKLYPRWWRERYGDELAALIEDARPGLGGAVDITKGAITMQITTFSAKRIWALGAIIGLAAGLAATLAWEPRYVSKAAIQITETDPVMHQAISENIASFVRAGGFSDKDSSILIPALGLYPDDRGKAVQRMKDAIRLSPRLDSTLGIEIDFEYADPHKAKIIVQVLVSRFLDSYIGESATREYLKQGPAFPRPTIVQNATLPQEPANPGRRGIALAGLAGGSVFGGLLALAIHIRRLRRNAKEQSGK